MPDKEFEEQVKDRLGEWSLEPSVAIRAQILQAVQQRRRRRAFLWIPALLGVLLVGAWGVFNWGAYRGHRGGAAPSANAISSTPSAAAPSATASSTPSATAPSAPSATASRPSTAAPSATASTPSAAAPSATASTPSGAGPSATASSAPSAPSAALPPSDTTPERNIRYERNGAIPDKGWAQVKATQGPHHPEPNRTIVDYAKGVPVEKTKMKWSIKIYGGAGFTGQGRFGTFRTPASDHLVNIPTSASTGLGTTGNPGTGTTYMDSLAGVKAMAGFQLGAQADFSLSRTLRWGVAIEYDFSKTSIGPVVSAPLYNYVPGVSYSGSRGMYYDNRYGLLSLPLDLTWNIPRLHSLKPALSLGLVPAYLVSVHALEYYPEGGYLIGKDLYQRWHLSGEAALSLEFWHFRDWAFSGGPFFRYDFQNLQRNAPVPDHLNSLEWRLALTRSFKKVSHEK